MTGVSMIEAALRASEGILRLAPTWVPRVLLSPGGRLRLDSRDLFALGPHRGGIDERWFASTTRALNGPGTPADEGLSYVDFDGARVLLKDVIEEPWEVLCKFFDNAFPIPHHMHQSDAQAALVGRAGKPEAYYFPRQYNASEQTFPYSFMGLEPGTTKGDIKACLARWHDGDNGILFHSKAYKLKCGSGWKVGPGILHAPGTLVTYEPQRNSDVGAWFQSMLMGKPVPWAMLVRDVPAEFHQDLDYLVGLLDWEANVDPHFAANHRIDPVPVRALEEMSDAGYCENWITYGMREFSAKELSVAPGRSVTMHDAAAYGAIVVQGHGTVGGVSVETPTLIRYGQMTSDELFVTGEAARRGVSITNRSGQEDLVMLKHFAPGNPDAKGVF